MTVFHAIDGQSPALATLERGLTTGRPHHAYRFEGPVGVGKELAAFALATTLVCQHAAAPLDACDACRHRVQTLTPEAPHVPLHPDVVVVQRGLYADVLKAGEATGISVEQIRRVVLPRTSPHEGAALVFIVRDAEDLTASAANAMLKTLEEPGPRVHFILLTSRPRRLIDTIRSRTLAVRFGPLPDAVVARILEDHGADPSVAALAHGSAALALELADEDRIKARETFLDQARKSLMASDLAVARDALDPKTLKRDDLRDKLQILALALAQEARDTVTRKPHRAERAAHRYAMVTEALGELDKNASPALLWESLVVRLRRG